MITDWLEDKMMNGDFPILYGTIIMLFITIPLDIILMPIELMIYVLKKFNV